MHNTPSLLFAILFFLGSLGCQIQGQPDGRSQDWPTREELSEAFRESRALLLVYGAEDPEMEALLARKADSLAESLRGRLEVGVKSARALSPEEAAANALLLVGTPAGNPWIRAMLPHLPFEWEPGALRFDGRTYRDSTLLLQLSFLPNPLAPNRPLWLSTALDEQYLAAAWSIRPGWRFWSSWGYELTLGGQRRVMGQLHPTDWTIDHALHFEFHPPDTPRFHTRHLRVFATPSVDSARLRRAARQWEAAVEAAAAWAGGEPGRLDVFAYGSSEEKGLMLRDSRPAGLDFGRQRMDAVVNAIYAGLPPEEPARWALRRLLGAPRTPVLEWGLALLLTEGWQRHGALSWAQALAHNDLLVPLETLFEAEGTESGSPLIRGAAAASFVQFLLEAFGKDTLLAHYRTWAPQDGELENLGERWQEWLAEAGGAPYLPAEERALPPFVKGFNFAHEGYRVFDGYGSGLSVEALQKQVELGANAVAIVPYSFQRDPTRPAPFPIPRRAGSETDESVVHAIHAARELGLAVLLKPQVWFGRGAWPGEVRMPSEEDWQTFFRHYREWIAHYAVLGEVHGAEALCLGVEFVHATLERERDWRELIASIRGIFSGQLTYAANWGREFEQLAFWDALDFIGLNNYYPLSKNPEASDAELAAGFQQVVEKIERVHRRYRKPVVFTEIGFRAKRAPWIDPHDGNRREPYFGEDQKRCYEIVFRGIAGKPWCGGIFWWKFPSHLEFSERPHAGFSPCNRPAEEVVRHWFGRLPGR